MRHQYKTIASATATNSAVLWDDGTSAVGKPDVAPCFSHLRACLYVDQQVLVTHQWAPARDAADGALKTFGTPATVSASTVTALKFALQPGRNRIIVTSGATAPTATFYARELEDFSGAIA